MKLKKLTIDTTDVPGVEQEQWVIYSDIGQNLQAAVDNWYVRTDEYTPESLCEYINSKGAHTALTEEQYKNR